ncbi:papilin-like [Amblyomma americanum]
MGKRQITVFLAVLQVISWIDAERQQERNQRCLKPPKLEGCSTVVLKWSYIEGENKCEQNFVCSGHPNSFTKEHDCTKACPPIHGKMPKPRKVDCMDWLLRGDRCYRYRFGWHPNSKGVRRWGMIYTGCGQWSNRLYFYDMKKRDCREIKRPNPKAE